MGTDRLTHEWRDSHVHLIHFTCGPGFQLAYALIEGGRINFGKI